mgnify:CR=1 FL=1
MKKTLILFVILILGFVLNSCREDRFQRLPEGEYDAIFTVQSGNYSYNPYYGTFKILESNDSYIIVQNVYTLRNNDTLYRSGNNITGTLHWHGSNYTTGHTTSFDDYSITGTISKDKGGFYLKGGLTTTITEPRSGYDTLWIDTLDAYGFFEFKSIF